MGRKKSWFSSVKKAFSPDSEEKKSKKSTKSKKKWFVKEKPSSISDSPVPDSDEITTHPIPPPEDVNVTDIVNEETKNTLYVEEEISKDETELADTEVSVEEEVVQIAIVSRFNGKSSEEVAAIKVQTAFRGYMARRALRALRGLVRLKSLVEGPTVKRQTANTLKCMQALSRVQSQIQSRRVRMVEENRALQRQILQKRAKEIESLKTGDEWDDSAQSKEQIEASLFQKYEAAMRRERAMAYSHSHQQMWKKSAKSSNLLFMDPTNPHWGWSWLERWMAARPWENNQIAPEKDDKSSTKSTNVGEITKSFARHQLNSDNPSSPAAAKPPPSGHHSPLSRKLKSASPKGSAISQDDDSKSIQSNRRHSIAGSSIRDDESITSSNMSVPSYMLSTQSAKAKSRIPASPLGAENVNVSTPVKKRLSYPPSPARARRHSGPPKVDTSSTIGDGVVN